MCLLQPKEIKDLKEFIKMMRREKSYLPKPDKITIKKTKRGVTKLKLRTPRYLFTHSVDDKSKAEKIMQSIPPALKKEHPDQNGKGR